MLHFLVLGGRGPSHGRKGHKLGGLLSQSGDLNRVKIAIRIEVFSHQRTLRPRLRLEIGLASGTTSAFLFVEHAKASFFGELDF